MKEIVKEMVREVVIEVLYNLQAIVINRQDRVTETKPWKPLTLKGLRGSF